MNVRQSHGPTRRLLLRLGPGDELVASLRALAEEHAIELAWVQGVGTLNRASLVGGKAGSEDGPWQLMNLGGSVQTEGGVVALSVHATLVSAGGQVTGGALRKADVAVAQLVVECFEAEGDRPRAKEVSRPKKVSRPSRAATRSEPAPRTWTEPEPDREDDDEDRDDEEDHGDNNSEAPAAVGGAVTWADVAALSATPEEEPAAPVQRARRPSRASRPGHAPPAPPQRAEVVPAVQELLPQKGDFVSHRQFGTCKVEREDGNGGIVLKLQSGVRKTIKLAYMEVGTPRDEGGRRVFPIRPRKR